MTRFLQSVAEVMRVSFGQFRTSMLGRGLAHFWRTVSEKRFLEVSTGSLAPEFHRFHAHSLNLLGNLQAFLPLLVGCKFVLQYIHISYV